MTPLFIPIETVPQSSAFQLDTLRRSYKTALSAENAKAAAPANGTVDEVFTKMFLVDVITPEPAGAATRVDLIYRGCIQTDGGDPVLPAQKTDIDDAVQSATSKKSASGQVLTDPATIQYYAPSSLLSYFSFGGPGTDHADDPTGDPRIISFACGDTTFTGGTTIQQIINAFFSIQIIETFKSAEIVPGKYWQNVSRKTKGYSSFLFSVTSGPYVLLASPGDGYTNGDILTISAGGESATIVVDLVGGVQGTGVLNWHVTANTFTAQHFLLAASGGTGHNAKFNVIIIP